MKQAKNAVERHVIWSDIHLDLDDWRDFLMENYPELPEDKLYEKMHELNAEYLDDERRNLTFSFHSRFLSLATLASGTDVRRDIRWSTPAISGTACIRIQI